MPCATDAAIVCPDREVIALIGDGSARCTLQSLWTMTPKNLVVTVIVFANRGHQTLREELAIVGIEKYGQNAHFAQRSCRLDHETKCSVLEICSIGAQKLRTVVEARN
ncbi:thiamine pyrophosphate-dependent enzyme [Ruegeria spongiae]|uniref:thiamine pyrophosphate-dependent enzyme n=1 Tax=Ruegeria spongiae TaxID=2942209 RepID=UPI0035715969